MAVRKKGNKWQVDVTVRGVRAPRVSATTEEEAKRIEAEFIKALEEGRPIKAETKASVLVAGTMGELLNITHRQKWSGTKAEASSLRNGTVWADAWGPDQQVNLVTPAMVADFCDELSTKGNSSGTINRKLAALSVMLGIAEERGLIERRFKMPKRKEYEGRLRWYSDAEVDSLLEFAAALDPVLACLFTLAVDTGMRQSEILGLSKRDVDLKKGLIYLHETKGNKRRSVPMTDNVKACCGWLVQGFKDHENIWPDNFTCRNISRYIHMWRNSQGIPKDDEACFHTFRHTCCARLVQRSVPLIVVQQWMGHKDINTTMRYAHLAPDSLDVALAALNGD